MKKTYETARELIDCLVDFHHRAALQAETWMDREQDERVRLVLNFLYEHHQQMQDSLATCEDDSDESALNEALAFELPAGDAPEDFIAGLDWGANMSYEAVARLGRDLTDYVINLLEDMAATVSAPAAQDLFDGLQELEQEESKLLLRAIGNVRDL